MTVPGNDAAPISISDLVRRTARTTPDATALVDGTNRLSWAEQILLLHPDSIGSYGP